MNAKIQSWIVGTLAAGVGALALGAFLVMVTPADPAVPSLRQEVLAAKVAAIQSARQATPSTTRSQSPVVAAATDSPRPGIAQLLGAVAAGIAGAIGLVLVGLSIWDRHGASQRITDAARTALRARLLEQAARIDKTPKPGAVERQELAPVESLTELRLELRAARRERRSRQQPSRNVA